MKVICRSKIRKITEALSGGIRLKKLRIILVCILAAAMLSGCENLLFKDNYVDLQPPSPESVNTVILTSFSDTIKAFSDITCEFTLQDIPAGVNMVEVMLKGTKWTFRSASGSFVIHPENYVPGIDTLKMNVYLQTGTGSIADMLGVENYMAEKTWTVILDRRGMPALKPVKSIDKSGYLKITWPKCTQLNFKSYHIEWSHNGTSRSKDFFSPDSCSIIDSSYVGGLAIYRVLTVVYGHEGDVNPGTLDLDDDAPVPIITALSYDSLLIRWPRSQYRCRYWLKLNSNTLLFDSFTDTCFKTVSPGFAKRESYVLYTTPFRAASTSDPNTRSKSANYILGSFVTGNWPTYGYNRIEKTIYTSGYDDMECYDVYSMVKKRSYRIDMLIYQGFYASPSNSKVVATISANNVYVFNDQYLTNPIVIPYECFGHEIDHFFATDNGLISIGTPSRFDIIDIAQGKVVAYAPIAHFPYYNKPESFATSKDGTRYCAISHTGVDYFSYENDTVIKIYTDDRAYNSVLFDEKDPDHILLKLKNSNTLEIRNKTDFSLVSSVDLFNFILCGFDPENGLLLVSDLSWLYVLDSTDYSVRFKMRCSILYLNMYAGRLFSNTGYTLNISDRL
jgi:hypothetical protein